ncbi:MAG: Uma2 family endonuclease, partial [Planctomycetota bacterium]
ARRLGNWLEERLPGGIVASGEAAVRIPGRETLVGVDVIVLDAETVAAQPPPPGKGEGIQAWHGVPRLIVEIMSPSDRVGDVDAKVNEYLTDGIPTVWIANPVMRSLTVHRPDELPRLYAGDELIPGGEALPGLELKVGDLFAP